MSDAPLNTTQPAPRIVLLSPDIPGCHSASHTGHAALRLAQRLVAEGAVVDLLVPRAAGSDWPHSHWWEEFRRRGIALHILPLEDGSDAMLGFRALEWLRARPAPAVLLAMDSRALAATPLLARTMGLVLKGVPIGVIVNAPSAWPAGPASPSQLLRRHLEAQAMLGADFLLLTGPELRSFCASVGLREKPAWVLGGLGQGEVQAGEAPPSLHLSDGLADAAAARMLANVLRELPEPLPALRMPMPRNSEIRGEDPLVAFVTAMAGEELALSLDLEARDPFAPRRFGSGSIVLLSPDGGGGPLSIDARAAGLPVILPEAAALRQALLTPPHLPVAEAWVSLLPFLLARTAPSQPRLDIASPPPLVSVCISHFDRPKLLAQTLDSLRAQTWPTVEVVLVDDASPSAETAAFLAAQEEDFAARGWQIIRNATEQWQAISRNTAARAARGEFILVMDDDNLARPHEIETMIRALLLTGADAVGAYQALFEGDHDALADDRPDRVEFFPTGGPADVGVVWNIYGDVNVMFRRTAFEAVGGYTAELELGCEDYEIGAALARDGRRLIIIPEALYLYRFSSVNMAKGMSNERLYWSHKRPLRPALAGLEPAAARLLAFTHGAEHSEQQGNGWSYWAGRAFHEDKPDYGIVGPMSSGDNFRLRVAMAVIEAGSAEHDAGLIVAQRILFTLMRSTPRDLHVARALSSLAVLRPHDDELRARLLEADRSCGTDLARDVLRSLLQAGRIDAARDWVAAGLEDCAWLLPVMAGQAEARTE